MVKKVKKSVKNSSRDNKKILSEYNKLKSLDKHKTEFVMNVIHDLKNPLSSIQGYIEYLLTGKFGELNLKQTKALMTSKDSVENLKNLINRILLLYKLESHEEKVKITKIDLKNLLDSVYEQEKAMFFNKPDVDFILEYLDEIKYIEADYEKIKQVIINLIDNAYKFTNRGSVSILVEKINPDKVKISVRDTGIGIAKKDQTTVFKRFGQVSETQPTTYKGLGLGLVIIQDLLKLHKTKISLVSTPGRGTTFSFILKEGKK